MIPLCRGGHRVCHTQTVMGWSSNMLVVGGVIYVLNSGQGSVKPHFQLDVTVPAKSMTKPLTDFRTGHRTVSFRTSTWPDFFLRWSAKIKARGEGPLLEDSHYLQFSLHLSSQSRLSLIVRQFDVLSAHSALYPALGCLRRNSWNSY
jgi:hypothetical protein